MEAQVILVDQQDNFLGTAGKLLVHQQGLLHRAFSVFVYRYQENHCEILLQQRHLHKYHSGGLWTNTCCSHPAPAETVIQAATRRLAEEMGISAKLHEIGVFHYTAPVGNKLIENEIDHVLIAEMRTSSAICADPEEVANYQWMKVEQLCDELAQNPERYTAWLPQALAIFCNRQ